VCHHVGNVSNIINIFKKVEKDSYSPSQEQASAVSRCIVGKTNFDSILGKFMAVSSTYDPVPFNSRVGNLE